MKINLLKDLLYNDIKLMIQFIDVFNCFLFIYIISIILLYVSCFIRMLNNKKNKFIIIIRGLPGTGKTCYVYKNELKYNNHFAISNINNYFITNKKYKFERKDLEKAEKFTTSIFLKYLKKKIPRIYITDVNNKKWMYMNLIKIAKKYNYKIKIIELICSDENYCKYFNTRSKFKIPMSYSIKCFNEWETDYNSIRKECYIGDHNGQLLGDSIPFPKKIKKELDKELIAYKSSRNTYNKYYTESDTVDSNESYTSTSDYSSYTTDSESCSSDNESEETKLLKNHKELNNKNIEIISKIKKNEIKNIKKRLIVFKF